eukprot:COSAG02_NODE_1098_length_14587_cov_9.462590_5_plen_77_part_00
MVRSTESTFTFICKNASRRFYTRFVSVFSVQILVAVRSDLSAGWCGSSQVKCIYTGCESEIAKATMRFMVQPGNPD